MFDGSQLPLEENIRITRKVVEVAHAVGVSVEGELGRLRGTEDEINVSEREAFFTDPEEAVTFVQGTGIDALAHLSAPPTELSRPDGFSTAKRSGKPGYHWCCMALPGTR